MILRKLEEQRVTTLKSMQITAIKITHILITYSTI